MYCEAANSETPDPSPELATQVKHPNVLPQTAVRVTVGVGLMVGEWVGVKVLVTAASEMTGRASKALAARRIPIWKVFFKLVP